MLGSAWGLELEGNPKVEAPGAGTGAAAGPAWFRDGEGGLASEPLELEGEGGGWYWGWEPPEEGVSRAPAAPAPEPVPPVREWRGHCHHNSLYPCQYNAA